MDARQIIEHGEYVNGEWVEYPRGTKVRVGDLVKLRHNFGGYKKGDLGFVKRNTVGEPPLGITIEFFKKRHNRSQFVVLWSYNDFYRNFLPAEKTDVLGKAKKALSGLGESKEDFPRAPRVGDLLVTNELKDSIYQVVHNNLQSWEDPERYEEHDMLYLELELVSGNTDYPHTLMYYNYQSFLRYFVPAKRETILDIAKRTLKR